MNFRMMMYVAVTAAAVVLVGSLANLKAQTSGANPVAVAVVDLETAIKSLEEVKDLDASATTEGEKLQQWATAQQQQIQQLQNNLKVLSEGTDDYKQIADQIQRQAISYKVEVDYRKNKIQADRALNVEMIYRKMLSMIESMAQQQGYDLVLFKEQMPEVQGATAEQILNLIAARKVLYSSPGIDITNQLTQKMNNEYNNRASKG